MPGASQGSVVHEVKRVTTIECLKVESGTRYEVLPNQQSALFTTVRNILSSKRQDTDIKAP